MASLLNPPRKRKAGSSIGRSQRIRVIIHVLFLMGLALAIAGLQLGKVIAQEPAAPDAAAPTAGAAAPAPAPAPGGGAQSLPPDAAVEAQKAEATNLDQSGAAAASGAAAVNATTVLGKPKPLELTIVNMIKWGGPVLWIIIALSVFGLAMAVYLFLTVTSSREVPANLAKRAFSQIRAGDLRGAYQMCEDREELLAAVIRAGLKASGHDRYVIQEAMESEGERGATALWQKISYLNNVGVIAPLLGLLGTVTGMIQSFNAIAFEDSQVKGIMMAIGVSQAMITTAAGLIVAIPAMALFFYLRGRVLRIVAEVEAQASEMVELLTQGRE